MAKGGIHLLLGTELGEKGDALEEIRRKLSPNPVEETSFYAGETAVSIIVSALLNGSLFCETRLFIVKNADLIKKKDETELLASYMKKPQDHTVLVLWSEENSLDKKLEEAAPSGSKRVFYELSDEKKAGWTADFFRRQGFRISGEGVQTILELVENNTGALRQECSRLTLFLDKNQVIDEETAAKWLAHTREESAFSLFSRLASGDLEKSLESLRALLAAKETAPAIIAGLVWCFRRLRDYQSLAARGLAGNFVELRKAGLANPQARGDCAEAARRYPSADPCLSLLAEYDPLIRAGGNTLESILMDNLVYRIIRTGARPQRIS
jgi:DNA polymerase-3 subunit delta